MAAWSLTLSPLVLSRQDEENPDHSGSSDDGQCEAKPDEPRKMLHL
jgi:hypothetical protein